MEQGALQWSKERLTTVLTDAHTHPMDRIC